MARTQKNSRDYWRERELEHAKNRLDDDMEVVRKMERLYRSTAREIEKEIQVMLSNYAERNELSMEEARKRVRQTDIRDFEEKAERYVREKNFSRRANEEMAIYNLKMRISRLQLTLYHIDLELVAMTDGLEALIYNQLVTTGMAEVERQAGILGATFEFDRTGVEYLASKKFHGDDFSDRLWKNKRLLHEELEKLLTQSISQGENPRKSARKLRQTIEQSVFNSERLLITESARVQSEVQMESFKEYGFQQYEFIVTEGACDICEPMDGEIFEVSTAQPGKNMPPIHPFCRCSTAAYESRELYETELERRGL